MKKPIFSLTCVILCLTILSGCAGKPAVSSPPPSPSAAASPSGAEAEVKTGLYVRADVSKSTPAEAEAEGVAQADVDFVAVTLGDDGVIDACVIDSVQAKVGFDTSGHLATDLSTQFPSKNELGEEYGMHKASGIGKEWNEQVKALADYMVGKTIEEVKGISLRDDNTAEDVDLSASVTIAIGKYLDAVEIAAQNAVHLGAQKGDVLALVSSSDIEDSQDAEGDEDGLVQTSVTVAAVTMRDDTITSCAIDAVQAKVGFDAAGDITTDLTASQPSKNELGESYGMKKASSIGKEWNEQAAAFCQYVAGKTVDQVAGIAVNEEGRPAAADLASSVTIRIGGFQALIEKAGRERA